MKGTSKEGKEKISKYAGIDPTSTPESAQEVVNSLFNGKPKPKNQSAVLERGSGTEAEGLTASAWVN